MTPLQKKIFDATVKILVVCAPVAIGSMLSYHSAKSDSSDGYATLAEEVAKLSGKMEILEQFCLARRGSLPAPASTSVSAVPAPLPAPPPVSLMAPPRPASVPVAAASSPKPEPIEKPEAMAAAPDKREIDVVQRHLPRSLEGALQQRREQRAKAAEAADILSQ